jgi:hypothetical protein
MLGCATAFGSERKMAHSKGCRQEYDSGNQTKTRLENVHKT